MFLAPPPPGRTYFPPRSDLMRILYMLRTRPSPHHTGHITITPHNAPLLAEGTPNPEAGPRKGPGQAGGETAPLWGRLEGGRMGHGGPVGRDLQATCGLAPPTFPHA